MLISQENDKNQNNIWIFDIDFLFHWGRIVILQYFLDRDAFSSHFWIWMLPGNGHIFANKNGSLGVVLKNMFFCKYCKRDPKRCCFHLCSDFVLTSHNFSDGMTAFWKLFFHQQAPTSLRWRPHRTPGRFCPRALACVDGTYAQSANKDIKSLRIEGIKGLEALKINQLVLSPHPVFSCKIFQIKDNRN